MINNKNILLASLLGGKVVQQLPRFAAVENEINKHVIPPISIVPLQNRTNEIYESNDYEEVSTWMNDKAKAPSAQFFPLSFRTEKDEDFWTLPWEPLIDLEANIRIAERYVAKSGKNLIGSIKERWSPDDYSITITGAFYGQKMRGPSSETYPREEMERLRKILLSPEAVEVQCELLQIYGINRISIYSMNFPFTKGESVQAYEIKAKSDFPWSLIYDRKKSRIDVGIPIGEFEK